MLSIWFCQCGSHIELSQKMLPPHMISRLFNWIIKPRISRLFSTEIFVFTRISSQKSPHKYRTSERKFILSLDLLSRKKHWNSQWNLEFQSLCNKGAIIFSESTRGLAGKVQDSWSLDHQCCEFETPATASVFVSLGKILNLNLLRWPERYSGTCRRLWGMLQSSADGACAWPAANRPR